MTKTILIVLPPERIPQPALERINAAADGKNHLGRKDHRDGKNEPSASARLVITDKKEEIEPLLGEVEIIAGHVPADWIEKASSLRWYQQWGAGVDWLMRRPQLAARDFILTNASGVHAIPISEHILAFLLAFARCLPEAIRAQDRGEWQHNDNQPVFELAGKTLLLVGVGAIGEHTAQSASALGMRVLGVRREKDRPAPGVERMYRPEELETVLPEADFVTLTVPLTPETRNMIGERELAKMKPSAYLINIGRGGTVDEPALVRALQSGQIAGAGLDVFAAEPLPPESPLWKMKNVIITAHYSGNTPRYDERALEIFIDNLERYMQGRPLRNIVDKELGY